MDILFSEEMVSLCVLLFDLYDQLTLADRKGEDFALGIERLIPYFRLVLQVFLILTQHPAYAQTCM